MICSYPENYLEEAMMNLGELLEYGQVACDTVPDTMMALFRISGLMQEWEQGNPRVLVGMSGTELHHRIMEAVGVQREWPAPLIRYDAGESYWCGWILAYLQWHTGESFDEIQGVMNCAEWMRIYPAMHTAAEEQSLELYLTRREKHRQCSRLQEYRKRIGLSQRQLAEAADVNLRTLQQYEIGDKDIRKASADKILRLCAVLNCRPEALLVPEAMHAHMKYWPLKP